MSYMDVMYGGLGSLNQSFQNNLAQNAAAMGNQQDYYNQVAALGSYNQAVTDQWNSDFDTKGASSGYGTVGGYPSFGEASGSGAGADSGTADWGGQAISSQAPAGSEGWWSNYLAALSGSGAGADSGTADWGGQAIENSTLDFNQLFPGYPYTGLPAEIDFGKSYPPNVSTPAATPQPSVDAVGLTGNKGGAAWDQTDQWGNSYAPSGDYTPSYPSTGSSSALQGPAGSEGWWPTYLATVGAEKAQQWMIDNGHSNTGGGFWDKSNQYGQSYAPKASASTSASQSSGSRDSIANTLLGFQYPGAGGLGQANVFNSAGQYKEQPGGWMTTGEPGMGIDGWGFGGAQGLTPGYQDQSARQGGGG